MFAYLFVVGVVPGGTYQVVVSLILPVTGRRGSVGEMQDWCWGRPRSIPSGGNVVLFYFIFSWFFFVSSILSCDGITTLTLRDEPLLCKITPTATHGEF